MSSEYPKERFTEKLNNTICNMNFKKHIIYLSVFTILIFTNCSVKYNFTGTGKIDAKTFQVNRFMNHANLVEPGIDRDFTLKLQDILQGQTNLNLTSTNGDLMYEGEITDYNFSPMAATADQKAAQTRLSITVNVRFINRKKESDNFEKKFSFFYDFEGNQMPTGSTLNNYIDIIFTRITQDIFNESLAKW
jgi:hypothetical protein